MTHTFKDGAIVANGNFYEEAIYNVSNEKISVIFDGKGAIKYYAKVNSTPYMSRYSSCIHVDGKHIDLFSPKTVTMLGRRQVLIVETQMGKLTVEQFLDKSIDGIYIFYALDTNNSGSEMDVSVFLTNRMDLVFTRSEGNVCVFKDNAQVNVKLSKQNPTAKVFITFDQSQINEDSLDFDGVYARCINEITSVKVPEGLNALQKALFYSCYFCALENYKEMGDFKAFTAGYKYLSPLRTYFRDSYYTVLPMYNGNTDKIKNQILTLAQGISENGTCPSAVKVDFSAHWGNHYDSPSFFVIMLYDYVHFTKDYGVLRCDSNGVSIIEKAEKIIVKMSEYADESGLLYKEGKFNKRDWTDEVNRYGYVTYDEILYARALYSLSKLMGITGKNEKAQFYISEYNRVKDAINRELWDEEKGYYVNFKNTDYVEDNLSIDTVLAVVFGISDDVRSKRLLLNIEKILETPNNPDIKTDDFGVMCVYPFYKQVNSAYWKSAQPLNYHNGSNWPYLSVMYAYAKKQYGMQYSYPLESWFIYNVEKGNYTPIEYFSPVCLDGSLLQAWSGAAAFVLDENISKDFYKDK